MADKKNKVEDKSPDFNDEYQQYGLNTFSIRLKDRINSAIKKKKLSAALINELGDVENKDAPDYVNEKPDEEDDQEDGAGDGWQYHFLTGRDGPKGCAHNVTLIFVNDYRWKGIFAENLFDNSIEVLRQPPIPEIEPGTLKDASVAMIHVWIEENYKIVVQDSAMRKALISTAAKNRYHPVQDWLRALPEWDMEIRINHWLEKSLGAKKEPSDYLKAVGSRFLIGAVARIMNAPKPTKVDNMLVFEGLQGEGKSTLVELLFSPWHGDTPLPLGDKDAFIGIKGKWGYEMAEMDSMNKASSSTAKAFLSSHTDSYRPPFGTKNEEFPRQTVFIGSSNHYEYLIDPSGNRRYWPVWASYIDKQWLIDNREQLWAEAYHCYKQKFKHWIDQKEEPKLTEMVRYEQSLREYPDAWAAKLHSWMQSSDCINSEYTALDLLTLCFGFDIRSVTRAHEMKLSDALQKLGWTKDRKTRKGTRMYLYQMPENDKKRIGVNNAQERNEVVL